MDALAGLASPPKEALRSALTDEDWRVRWAAVRAEAKVRGVPEKQSLAEWVASVPASAQLVACLTAARASAEAGLPPQGFLKGAGPKAGAALERIKARQDDIRGALEVELYAQSLQERGRALAHLSTFLGLPPARVVMGAMASRPESVDEAVAQALFHVAELQRSSVGRMLLEVAKPEDEALVNRLFAVYSRELEALQPELAAADLTARRSAVFSLKRYGPLATKELTRAMEDADRLVRHHAARGLAEAEGLTVLDAARRKLRPEAGLSALRPWLEVVTREKEGAALLLAVAEDARQPADVRGEAVARLGECEDGGKEQRFRRLAPFLQHAEPRVRAGAVRALGAMPRGNEAVEAVTRALEDPAPEVLVAALDGVAALRQASRGDTAARLLGSPSAEVREAAARALEFIGRASHTPGLVTCLKGDASAAVRVAAARSLGVLGGPQAVGALTEALQQDKDTHVQHVAREALQRLGFLPR